VAEMVFKAPNNSSENRVMQAAPAGTADRQLHQIERTISRFSYFRQDVVSGKGPKWRSGSEVPYTRWQSKQGPSFQLQAKDALRPVIAVQACPAMPPIGSTIMVR